MNAGSKRPKGQHGGRRAGAGRKVRFDFFFMLEVGAACEERLLEAQNSVKANSRHYLLHEVSDLQSLWNKSDQIPVSKRPAWLVSDAFEDHQADIEEERSLIRSEVAMVSRKTRRAAKNAPSGSEEGVDQPTKIPVPRGTRRRILREIAATYKLTENQVDNLWQQKRRFEAAAEAEMPIGDYKPPRS